MRYILQNLFYGICIKCLLPAVTLEQNGKRKKVRLQSQVHGLSVKQLNGFHVTLHKNGTKRQITEEHTKLMTIKFPEFKNIELFNQCI